MAYLKKNKTPQHGGPIKTWIGRKGKQTHLSQTAEEYQKAFDQDNCTDTTSGQEPWDQSH